MKEGILKHEKITKIVYADLTSTDVTIRKVCYFWNEKLGTEYNVSQFRTFFKNIYRNTNIVKFRNFQYRLLHNKIFCNNILFHWKKVNSQTCNLCNKSKQDILHLLFHCQISKNVLTEVTNWLELHVKEINIMLENVILNKVHPNANNISNFVILVYKQFIFRCKCLNQVPKIQTFFSKLEMLHDIEYYNAVKQNLTNKHIKKWSPVFQ